MKRRRVTKWLVRVVAAVAGLAALLLFFPACNTPFIPLPPPGNPTFTPVMVSDGMGGMRTAWETRGAPNAAMVGAKVSVFNADLGTGVIARAQSDGAYVASPMEGRLGDRIQIRYETTDSRSSPDICRVLASGPAQADCPARSP